jgi:hypothetical protein
MNLLYRWNSVIEFFGIIISKSGFYLFFKRDINLRFLISIMTNSIHKMNHQDIKSQLFKIEQRITEILYNLELLEKDDQRILLK